MDTNSRNEHIKSIIKLENRVADCNRCPSLLRCSNRPALGKGDLEPDVFMVFGSETSYNRDSSWLIGLRSQLREQLKVRGIYHSFLVRCHTKTCTQFQNNSFCLTDNLLDRNDMCLLTGQICNAMHIQPSNDTIINCLTYLMEEIDILNPAYLILFGERVSDFVLKACGYHDNQSIVNNRDGGPLIISTLKEEYFDLAEMQKVKTLLEIE